MASASLKTAYIFPPETVVRAFRASNWNPNSPPSGEPIGKHEAEMTVDELGTLRLSGLEEGVPYVAVAEIEPGDWRYVHFRAKDPDTHESAADISGPLSSFPVPSQENKGLIGYDSEHDAYLRSDGYGWLVVRAA